MALSKKSTATTAAKTKVVDHSKEIKALEVKVAELTKLLEAATKQIKALAESSKQPVACVDCVDKELRKKLAAWNPKLGKKL